jgi:hypothetical protein
MSTEAIRGEQRTWRHLAKERIEDTRPTIQLGNRVRPLGEDERLAITRLFEAEHVKRLATMLRNRDDDASVRLVDAAYWPKGCSSLGRLRYFVLLEVGEDKPEIFPDGRRRSKPSSRLVHPQTGLPGSGGLMGTEPYSAFVLVRSSPWPILGSRVRRPRRLPQVS